VQERLHEINLTAEREDVLRQHHALVEGLRTHARETFRVVLTRAQAEDALLSHIIERAAPLLATVVEGTPPPASGPAPRDADVVVGAYIAHVHHQDPAAFDYLATVVKGAVLASALYLPDLGKAEQSFRDVAFYFDTRLLMRACGFAGPELAEASRELLNLLAAEGGRLYCFEHNLTEMEGILEASIATLRDPRRKRDANGETITFFLETGASVTDVVRDLDGLRDRLGELGVLVKARPDHKTGLTVDEDALAADLRREVGYGSDRPEPVNADVDSLTSIWRLRGGARRTRLERCVAVFVTTNTSLATVARRFFRQESPGQGIPVALPEHYVATIAWLKKPGHAPDLPAKIVLADCYAALQPSDVCWQMYLEKARNLQAAGDVTPAQYEMLRHSLQVRALVLQQTRFRDEPMSEGDARELLARAEATIAGDVRDELRRTRADLETEAAARMRAEEAARAAEERAAAEADGRRQSAVEVARERYLERKRFADRAGRLARQCFGCALFVVALALAYLVAPAPFGARIDHWPLGGRLIAGVALAFSAVAGALSASGRVVHWDRWIEARVSAQVLAWQSRWSRGDVDRVEMDLLSALMFAGPSDVPDQRVESRVSM
jgi:hypothetical protein